MFSIFPPQTTLLTFRSHYNDPCYMKTFRKFWFFSIHNALFIHWCHLTFYNHCKLSTSIHIILVNLLTTSQTIYTKITWLFISTIHITILEFYTNALKEPKEKKNALIFAHKNYLVFRYTSAISFSFGYLSKDR